MDEMNDDEILAKLQAEMENPNPEPPAPEVPSAADRLHDAQVHGNKQNFYADLLKSFQGAIQASAPNSGFKADTSIADGMAARSGQSLQNVQNQLKQEAAAKVAAQEAEKHKLFVDEAKNKLTLSNIQVEDTKESHKPGSKISLAQVAILKDYLNMIGKPYDERSVDALSADEAMKLIPNMEKIGFEYFKQTEADKRMKNENIQKGLDRQQKVDSDAARLKLEEERNKRLDDMEERRIGKEARQEKEGNRRYRQQQINTVRGVLKDDPRFKKTMEQTMAFDDVAQLLKEAEGGNEQAVGALGTKLARAMGEVGVLTDTDVVRYVAGQSWGRKLRDWFTKGAIGQLSPETIKGIKANIKTLKSKMDGDVNRVIDNSSSRIKQMYPELEDEDIRGMLGYNGGAKSDAGKSPYGEDVIERDGKKYKWNPSAPNPKTGKPGGYQIIGE